MEKIVLKSLGIIQNATNSAVLVFAKMVLNSEELTVQGSLYYVQNNHFYRNFSIVWAAWNEWEQCSIRYKGFPSGGKYPEGLKVGIKLFCVIF